MGVSEFQIRPGDRSLVLRSVVGSAVVLGIVAAGLVLPHPSALTVRAWSQSAGWWFVLVFFLVHVVVTVFPIPRTVFTASAGLLFGPSGIALCVAASTIAAVIAFVAVREIDRRHPSAVIGRIREHRTFAPIAARLRARGWLAVGSLRLIAPMPFSILNYAAALSPVRLWPYVGATVIGLLPGTAALVLLGDAITGQSSPWLVTISVGLFVLGLVGLTIDARRPARPGA